jgi:lipopolysaccharide export system protein LptA
MPLNTLRLRRWLALSIALILIVVAGYYVRGYYTRWVLNKVIQSKAEKLGINVQQSTDTFTFSKSEGGHTLFTVRASKAVQQKGGHAELHEVDIIVYGKDNNRYDQIYGSDFEYEPATGEVSAKGEVHIDLQGTAEGEVRPDQAPPKELKNPIHLLTHGLVFNRNTGVAQTNQRIEFRIPQANGSAIGATYDSKAQKLTLHSQIELENTGDNAAHLAATHGVITNDPPRVEFTNAHVTRETSDITAQQLVVYLRKDNSIERLTGNGNVTAEMKGQRDARVVAPSGEAVLDSKNHVTSAQLTGGVQIESKGGQPMHGNAGRVLLSFGGNSRVDKVRAMDSVKLVQDAPRDKPQSQAMTLTSGEVDFLMNGRGQRHAETTGPAQIVLASAPGVQNPANTVVTADRLIAGFDKSGKITNLVGSPNAKVVSTTNGQPDKVTTSDVLTLTMNPNGGLDNIVQQGHFHYVEGAVKTGEAGSEAFAQKATYSPQTEMFNLTGSPRVTDAGVTTTADRMRINRRTGDAVAEGSVKTTYSQIQAQPNGALLATSDPIHVTAASMTARRADEIAHYSGGARLWQGANIVEAPTIDFNRAQRTVTATGNPSKLVSTVFVQQAQNGKQTPVNVTGSRLTYADANRQAKFEGGVVMRSADGTVTADHVTVFLLARPTSGAGSAANSASELEKVVAEGRVVIQQQGRRGTGNRLTYSAKNGSFTLTGGPPSIFDAEHGKVTGDSLTFFSHDDRVLVEGGNSAQSVTKARVIK